MRNSKSNIELYSFYINLVRSQKKSIFIHFLLLMISIGIQVPSPFLVSKVIDELSHKSPLIQLLPFIACLVGIMIFGVLFGVVIKINAASINKKFIYETQLITFSSFQSAPQKFINKFNITDVFSRLGRDVGTLNYLSPTGIAGVVRDLCFIVVFGGVLIYMNFTIVMIIVGLLPLAAFYFKFSRKKLSSLSSSAYENHASTNSKLLESITGIRDFRTVGTLSFNELRLALSLDNSGDSFLQVSKYRALMFGVLGSIPVLASALIWTVGGLSIESGEMSVGQLIAFLFVMTMLYGPINSLFGAASGYVYEQAALKRIADISYEPFEEMNNSDDISVSDKIDALDNKSSTAPLTVYLKNISFSYKDKLVFSEFNAIISAGFCTSIVGCNGSGKSTLLSIIMGVIPPDTGQVFIANDALKELKYYPKHIGFLPQDIFILEGSLRLNITLGRKISDEQIYESINQLGLYDFLTEWHDGLDFFVQEGGRNISGGRKQKIGLIRAVLNNPTLLVMDEPENNLDKDALNGLNNYLKKLKGFCTIVLVTHGETFNDLVDANIKL